MDRESKHSAIGVEPRPICSWEFEGKKHYQQKWRLQHEVHEATRLR